MCWVYIFFCEYEQIQISFAIKWAYNDGHMYMYMILSVSNHYGVHSFCMLINVIPYIYMYEFSQNIKCRHSNPPNIYALYLSNELYQNTNTQDERQQRNNCINWCKRASLWRTQLSPRAKIHIIWYQLHAKMAPREQSKMIHCLTEKSAIQSLMR